VLKIKQALVKKNGEQSLNSARHFDHQF